LSKKERVALLNDNQELEQLLQRIQSGAKVEFVKNIKPEALRKAAVFLEEYSKEITSLKTEGNKKKEQ
jgi:vacuolar-type H+-ATPase subunit E/Vma4